MQGISSIFAMKKIVSDLGIPIENTNLSLRILRFGPIYQELLLSGVFFQFNNSKNQFLASMGN